MKVLKELMAADGDGTKTLRAQTEVLDALFHKLTALALSQENLAAIESLMKLALKAQGQSRRTAEALATIRQPPMFAKQLNVGHAVQVNNASDRLAVEKSSQNALNELSSREHGHQEEPRAIEAHSSVETLGAIDWAENAGRESALAHERL